MRLRRSTIAEGSRIGSEVASQFRALGSMKDSVYLHAVRFHDDSVYHSDSTEYYSVGKLRLPSWQ